MDTRGIDFWVAVGKYRVRIHRNRVTYKIGLFDTMDEALEAKHRFLEEYALKSDETDAVPTYTKEWFVRQHRQQVKDFAQYYGESVQNKPRFIIVSDDLEPHFLLSTSNMRTKQALENDGGDFTPTR